MSTNHFQQPLPVNPSKPFTELIKDCQESLEVFIKLPWRNYRNKFHRAGKANMHNSVYNQIVELQLKLANLKEDLEWLEKRKSENT